MARGNYFLLPWMDAIYFLGISLVMAHSMETNELKIVFNAEFGNRLRREVNFLKSDDWSIQVSEDGGMKCTFKITADGSLPVNDLYTVSDEIADYYVTILSLAEVSYVLLLLTLIYIIGTDIELAEFRC